MDQNRDKIELIKEKLDIVQVVEKYVRLKQAGRNHRGLCPFHNEKTPSFNVNPEMQIFKCFGCGKGGDIFTFVQEIEKSDFPDTLEKLAQMAGVKLDRKPEDAKHKFINEINEFSAEFFHQQLSKDEKAKKYLKERGVSVDSIKQFQIGYAPKGNLLLKELTNKYTKAELSNSGLFVEKENHLRDKFLDRIMFPVRSTRGKVIAFSGRILPDNKYGPKYLNSPETVVYKKKYSVYGLFEAKESIRKNDLCVMYEGQTDVISSHTAGVSNSVAPLGTALTAEQLELLSRHTKNFLFVLDSDKAGQEALARNFSLVSSLNLNPYGASPAPYKDIDELVQDDPEKLDSLIKKKTDLFSYLLTQFIKKKNLTDYKDYKLTSDYINRLLESVKKPDLKNFYLEKVEKITGIDLKEANDTSAALVSSSTAAKSSRITFEKYYLQTLVSKPEITIPDSHKSEVFIDPDVKGVLEKIREIQPITQKKLHEKLDGPQKDILEDLLLRSNFADEDIERLYNRVLKNFLETRLKKYRVILASAEENKDKKKVDKYIEYVKRYTDKLSELK